MDFGYVGPFSRFGSVWIFLDGELGCVLETFRVGIGWREAGRTYAHMHIWDLFGRAAEAQAGYWVTDVAILETRRKKGKEKKKETLLRVRVRARKKIAWSCFLGRGREKRGPILLFQQDGNYFHGWLLQG